MHECQPVDTPVTQCLKQAGEVRTLGLGLVIIADADIFLHAEFGESHLFRREEAIGVLGEIRNHEHSDDGDHDRQCTLDEKEPPETDDGERIL